MSVDYLCGKVNRHLRQYIFPYRNLVTDYFIALTQHAPNGVVVIYLVPVEPYFNLNKIPLLLCNKKLDI